MVEIKRNDVLQNNDRKRVSSYEKDISEGSRMQRAGSLCTL